MDQPYIIAITGGIGSGKSTVASKFRSRGYKIYNTDNEARRLQNTDIELIENMKELLGVDAFDGNIMNRQKVAERVFQDKNLLEKLSLLVHPAVKKDFKNWVETNSNEKVLLMECAVLFEGGFDLLADWIVAVTADDDIRIERVMGRDNLSYEKVVARMNNQKSQDELIERSNYNLDTNSGEEFIDAQIDEILSIIL